ncbi:MAG: hypothetical protein AAF725_06995 [Acidobacteriota bacterium]
MRLLTALMACLLMAPAALQAQGQDLPAPPDGYSWEKCSDIDGALLRPDSWSFRRVATDGSLSYYLTPKAWEPPAPLGTGFTLSVFFNVPAKFGRPPAEFARGFIENAKRIYGGEELGTSAMGPLEGQSVTYLGKGNTAETKFFNRIAANDETGTVFLVVFEGPQASWESDWKTIEPTIQQIVFGEGY